WGRLDLGAHVTHVRAATDNYVADNLRQSRPALFAAYRHTAAAGRLEGSLSLRQEWIATSDQTTRSVPLMPSAGVTYAPAEGWRLRGHAARSFRVPTFNDLYWQPGGNPALRPERGWSAELGAERAATHGAWAYEGRATLFSHWLRDRLVWRPETFYWSPVNVAAVWNRGAELAGCLGRRVGEVEVSVGGQYQYVRAEPKGATDAAERGGQLFYVPLHQGHGSLTLAYRRWNLRYRHVVVGYRYTTTDNTDFLPTHDLGQWIVSRGWSAATWGGSAFLQVDNLWNRAYQVMPGRPMPGHALRFGFVLHLHQKATS
ncbi:MAG: TonB-dependent receptor, partial [Catalinimonas sp.]